MLCDPKSGDFTLQRNSPCATGVDILYGILGAWGVGCFPTDDRLKPPSEHPELELAITTNPIRSNGGWISYRVPWTDHAASAVLDIYDATGRLVRQIAESHANPGSNRVLWDGRNRSGERVAPGIYFCNLRWNGAQTTKRMLVVR